MLLIPERAAALFQESVAIMARLRAPGGCPWDREQSSTPFANTHSKRPTRSSTQSSGATFPIWPKNSAICCCRCCSMRRWPPTKGHFTIADVLDHLNRKLIRRHPHVFGEEASRAAGNRADVDAAVEGSSARCCATGKRSRPRNMRRCGGEANQPQSRLDSCQRAMPALAEAAKLGAKARKAGFDWPTGATCCPSWPKRPRSLRPKLPRPDDPSRASRC